eukprot:g8592.t1
MKGDAKAQEHCQQQLGGLMKSLLKACKKAKPRSNFLGGGSILLPPKNCNESVKDLFLHGQDLLKVETSQMLRQARKEEDKLNKNLLKAIESQDVPFVKWLLEQKADPGRPSSSWAWGLALHRRALQDAMVTPLHLAAEHCDAAAVQQLLRCGAPTEARAEGGTALKAVAVPRVLGAGGRPCAAVAEELLQHGANVSARDIFGRTALEVALQESNTAVAEVRPVCSIGPEALLARPQQRPQRLKLGPASCWCTWNSRRRFRLHKGSQRPGRFA